MRVIDTRRPRAPLVAEISVAPAYELLMSLCLWGTPRDEWSTYDVGAEWFEETGRRMSPALRKAMELGTMPHEMGWAHLVGMAYETDAPRDVEAFLCHVEATPPRDLLLHLLGYHYHETHGAPRDVILAAASGDEAAAEQLMTTWYHDDPKEKEALRRLLTADPEATKGTILTILRLWNDDVFRPQEDGIMPILKRDAAAKEQVARGVTAERLTEIATNGLQYSPEAWIERVVLIPTFVFRPWAMISEYRDAKIFAYPVADASLEADVDAPPAHLLRLYEALADERRLKVVRRLANETLSLGEMAEWLGIAKSTMHHHVALLRAAGLLATSGDKRYTLRREALHELPGILDAYLDDRSDEPRQEGEGKT